jgi:hypothetical protein
MDPYLVVVIIDTEVIRLIASAEVPTHRANVALTWTELGLMSVENYVTTDHQIRSLPSRQQ